MVERREDGGVHEYVASILEDLLSGADPEKSIQSSVVATGCKQEGTVIPPVVASINDSRYACVIVIGSTDFFNVSKPKFVSLGGRDRIVRMTTRSVSA
ncbi:hypothetical protein F441_13738 [Phytophthora nicotianae CJ01A1]|uniref:Uncharacterized protein n=3 Tax=Phytophthora nicotianae TaxID=4792 RepID=W2MZ44_PHYNI|nr:hypothetical protein L915_13465 [Phytophthora nicotianae]ETL34420.1 hypothetical protein L916_13354 [Phytophthora nicotianae]ETM40918.1 hypothetical protein L914_13263 [Phytophthora nicotianae]ETO69604.1 hypothetical protein F444_13865 [Phytophthora nicotianae P1976]ETP10703.1 hypothetical protein F441_13738 [Phytophthora nicotianae CJ01A1]